MRNVEPALGFAVGLHYDKEGDGFVTSFSNRLARANGAAVFLTISDERADSQIPLATHRVRSDSPPFDVVRSDLLAPFADGDFFFVDANPAEGGPGIAVGYILDIEGTEAVIEPTTNDFDTCPVNEILRLRFSGGAPLFRRGDADGNGRINVSDIIVALRSILGIDPPRFDCDDALDSNDDGRANVSDILPIIRFIFLRGEDLPPPLTGCGIDPTPDGLRCTESSPGCAQ